MEKYYIVRSDRAGVFFGKIKERKERSVVMTDVRKIFQWSRACAVEQISVDGVGPGSKLTVEVSECEVDSPIQIIPCTDKAAGNLKNFKVWKV